MGTNGFSLDHPVDVLVGSVVGLVISHYAYRQYFPSLTHPLCHRPYVPQFPLSVAAFCNASLPFIADIRLEFLVRKNRKAHLSKINLHRQEPKAQTSLLDQI